MAVINLDITEVAIHRDKDGSTIPILLTGHAVDHQGKVMDMKG